MFRAPRELVHRLAGERLVHRHIVQLAELKDVREEEGYERRQGRLSREMGHMTYNMSAVRCSF